MAWYKNIRWNIPNLLSAYRLLTFPVLLALILWHRERPFATLLCINLITDIADGYIARRFNMQTPEGAILDSTADFGSYILAILGIYTFHHYLFTDNYLFISFIAVYILSIIVALIKFKRPVVGLHLYSAKIAGYAQGIFFFVLFTYGMQTILFMIAMSIGFYSLIEGIIINSHSKQPVLNAKTIWHYFKSLENDRKN
jgi:cardiolipin synthase (CMP-forming)